MASGMTWNDWWTINGGAGSGNFGHAGRPGEVGGSSPGGPGSGGGRGADTLAQKLEFDKLKKAHLAAESSLAQTRKKWDAAFQALTKKGVYDSGVPAMSRLNKKIAADAAVARSAKEAYEGHPLNTEAAAARARREASVAEDQMKWDNPTYLPPSKVPAGTKFTIGQLMDSALAAGKRLYGPDLIRTDGVQKVIVRPLNARAVTGNIEYVFFPSQKGKGLDTPGGTKLHKGMADKDGNIYIYTATDSAGAIPKIKIYKTR